METFLRWAAEIGISDSVDSSPFRDSCLGHSLSVADFPLAGGRGLGAVRELKKGESVLKVPRSALMTTESMVAKDRNLSDAVNLHKSLSTTQILSVCLLDEMGNPHLVHYHLLATFGEFEKQAFQVEDAVWATEKAIAKFQSEWKEAVTLMKELELKPKFQSFQAWLWASATISSRTLHVPWDSAGCLCPVGDLFNYDAPGDDSNTSEGQTSSPQATSTTNNECQNTAEEAGLV